MNGEYSTVMIRLKRRAIVVQQTATTTIPLLDAVTTSSAGSSPTTRRRKKGKHTTMTASGTVEMTANAGGISRDASGVKQVPTDTAIIAAAPDDQSSLSTNKTNHSQNLQPGTFYALIATGSVLLLMLLSCTCFCVRRKRKQQLRQRQTIDWFGVQAKNVNADEFDNGKEKFEDDIVSQGKEVRQDENKYYHATKAVMPAALKSSKSLADIYNRGQASTEKQLEISKPYGMQMPVTDPRCAPQRPPRPSAQIDFNTSPTRVLQQTNQKQNYEDMSPRDQEEYERNILALTTSMAFDTPRIERYSRSFAKAGERDIDIETASASADGLGRDTIVGLAESYADLASPMIPQDEPVPVRPLHIRNPSSASGLVKRPKFTQQVSDDSLARIRQQSSREGPPTLSAVNLDLGVAESTSMQELEDVLGSFGRTVTPTEKVKRPEDYGHQSAGMSPYATDEHAAQKARQAYRLAEPMSIERELSVVRNALSVHSSTGEVVDGSTPRLGGDAKLLDGMHKRYSIIANDSSETLVDPPSSSPHRRVSFALQEPDEKPPRERIESLAELVRSRSLKQFNENSPVTNDIRGAFGDEDNYTMPSANERTGLQALQARVRSSTFHGLSPALHSAWRPDRQRTATTQGTGSYNSPRLPSLFLERRKTTDSEARFALGSHMLNGLDSPVPPSVRGTPGLPYLRSPDLRVQPPSPSQASDGTTFSVAPERERKYRDKLAQEGFVPLAEMAVQSKGHVHSPYYRSPIDSIVGVFEFDDHKHSVMMNTVT